MKLMWQLAKESWKLLVAAGVLGALSGITNVALLAIIHQALEQPGASTSRLLALFFACCLAVLLTRIGSQVFLVRLSQKSISRVRLGLCQRILESPLRHLEEIGSHRMLSSLTGDVQMLAYALHSVPSVGISVVILCCGAIYLGMLSSTVLVGALLFTALGIASYWYTSRWAKPYLQAGRELQDVLLRHIRSLIHGVKEMKIHHQRRRDFVERMLQPTEAEVRENQFIGDCLQDAAATWGRLLFMVAIGLLLFAWPRIQQLDARTLTGYTLAIFFLMSPLERIVGSLPLMVRAAISANKIQRLGLMLGEEPAEATAVTPIASWERIELSAVTHVYYREGHERGFLLGPIDLTLRPGEIVFIVGGNGSGKTTLAKLLTGLYVPEEGEIRLDGEPIGAENRESYRQLFTAIFDDAVVFEGLLGLEAPDRDGQAARYLRELRLDHVVRVADGVFSTTELSRGQRKRLALLTAYLENRSLYLFDEWAADQDPAFKRTFYQQILPELKRRGKTVIAITHDDRYFIGADRVIKLEEGRVVEAASGELPAEQTLQKA
jgi:putative ATP-binding cassette transporter